MAKAQKKSGDLTGRRLAEQQEEARKAEKDRSKELAMVTAQNAALAENGVFDPETGAAIPEEELEEVEDLTALTLDEDDEDFQEFDEDPEDVSSEPMVIVRIAEDFTTCIGVPGDPKSWHTFERGKKYRMPKSNAEYLDTKGVIWH